MLRLIGCITLFACLTVPAPAQDLQLTLGAGYSSIRSPGSFSDPIALGGYGFDHSIPLVAGLRYTFIERRITIAASAIYQRFSSTGSSKPYIENLGLLPIEVRTKTNVWTASIGLEWPLLQSIDMPHLGMDLLVTSVGSIDYIRDPFGRMLYYRPPSVMQYGVALSGGITAPCFFGSSLDLDIRYAWHGAFATSDDWKSIDSIQLMALLNIPIWSNKPTR